MKSEIVKNCVNALLVLFTRLFLYLSFIGLVFEGEYPVYVKTIVLLFVIFDNVTNYFLLMDTMEKEQDE